MTKHVANLLSSHGFSTSIKNTNLADGAVPRIIAPFEIWVSESNFTQAEELLQRVLTQDESKGAPWKCRKCGELAESQFTECWSCGDSR